MNSTWTTVSQVSTHSLHLIQQILYSLFQRQFGDSQEMSPTFTGIHRQISCEMPFKIQEKKNHNFSWKAVYVNRNADGQISTAQSVGSIRNKIGICSGFLTENAKNVRCTEVLV